MQTESGTRQTHYAGDGVHRTLLHASPFTSRFDRAMLSLFLCLHKRHAMQSLLFYNSPREVTKAKNFISFDRTGMDHGNGRMVSTPISLGRSICRASQGPRTELTSLKDSQIQFFASVAGCYRRRHYIRMQAVRQKQGPKQ